jgi:hypothetical protein
MHESDAFERQIAGEMMRRAGPIRSVDDAAIWAAVVATKAPNRSIGGFLGVIRFAAAGVIAVRVLHPECVGIEYDLRR